MQEIFTFLTVALEKSFFISLFASFVWGVFSILLSPCHLASIPLIVGFIDDQGRISLKRTFWIATLFSLGIMITIALIGIITGLMGRMLGNVGSFGNYFVAIIFFVFGLHLIGVITLPFMGNAAQPRFKKRGLFAALILGLLFGIALGPCTFAFMAPMLGVAFKVASTNLILAMLLIFFYAIGHCSVIILAGVSTEIVQKYLNWNERSKGTKIVKIVCGILLILGGIYLIISVQ
ncbi:cytochrome C biogenesis protein [bacterium]|nr:cytochrome C biogenesis protein [bacterium]